MWNPQFILFLYDKTKSSLLRTYKRWVPPPLNPPSMIDEERDEATTHHVSNPPLCKCGYHSELMNPATGLDYTPF
jgi:hypothetical protein